MLNKHVMPYDLEKLVLLDNFNWKNHIPKRLIFYEELQVEDNDGLLVENGEQHELDIDVDEWFRLIWNKIVYDKTTPP